MKTIIAIIILMIGFQSIIFSQTEKDITSKIKKVTVYTKGAQIESEAKVELQQGKFLLKFKNLSPDIEEGSIKVEGNGKFSILNVQLSEDYINSLDKSKEINDLNSSIQQYQDKIEDEETGIKITNEKMDFLRTNKNLTGNDKSVNPEAYKSLITIYGDNIEKYSMDLLKRQRLIKDYKKEMEKLSKQLSTISSRNETPSGVITVPVDSKQNQSATIKLTYMVDKAQWYPSYDIRYVSADKPLSISYKANINQNTGIDWKDVELKLSTAKTNISGQIPELSANYLRFYYPEITNKLRGETAGVMITSQDSVTGANSAIRIRGIATMNGSANPLYVVDGLVVGTNANFLTPEDVESIKVLKDASATAIYGSSGANGVVLITTKKNSKKAKAPLTITSKNETSVEFSIEGKQTVNSDNQLNTIIFKDAEIEATYEYQAIPKLSKNVYLIGKINDWTKADLADGETNLFFENSFIGNSKINTKQFTDTLDISFGIDNNIIVNREKIKDFSEKQFVGSNKKETHAWKLSVRNNKAYPVKVKLFDQVPVSSTKEIQVEPLELSGGILNSDTGMVQWIVDLKPNESKQIILKYFVKYPKDKVVAGE